jgi:hypothetical protein
MWLSRTRVVALAVALAGVYRGIAVSIPCPADAFWGRR